MTGFTVLNKLVNKFIHSYIYDSRYREIWADPPNNNELSNAVPKYEEIGQYWSKRDIIEYE